MLLSCLVVSLIARPEMVKYKGVFAGDGIFDMSGLIERYVSNQIMVRIYPAQHCAFGERAWQPVGVCNLAPT